MILILRDLCPAHLSVEACALLPRLPALEQWLVRGERQPVADGWRPWLQRELGGPGLSAAAPAAIAAAALASPPAGASLWLATPVHFIAGLDTVRVHPAGLLQLDAAEQEALQRDFARDFAGSGCHLHVTGRRELLFALPHDAGSVRSDDPSLWLGADPRDGLPSGTGANPLRRLGSELEMWLHWHPINEARAAGGQLGVSALWLWGGGAPLAREGGEATAPESASTTVAWADELYVDGLARHAGFRVQPLPRRWPPLASGHGSPELRLVVPAAGAAPGPDSLVAIERDWIAPALVQWRRGDVDELTLLAGRSAVTLRRRRLRSLWRALQPSRPWWEQLQSC
jgi:hypothetical protein